MSKLDNTDLKILELLQKNAKMTNLELADAINLSPTPCARRVKRLEDEGVILRYATIIDPRALGLNMTVFLSITLEKHGDANFQAFEKAIAAFPEVVECSVVTGRQEDLLLKVVVEDMAHYERFLLTKINTLPGVDTAHTSVEMRSVVSGGSIAIDRKKDR